MASTTQSRPVARSLSARLNLGSLFRAESSTFYLIAGTTVLLVVIGLVMVLSASSVDSFLADEGFYGRFLKQLTFAILGVPVMLIASRLPLVFYKKWAVLFLVISAVAQLLVFTPLGYETGGNRNWIRVGSFNAQPSELLKLALALWLGLALPKSMQRNGNHWKVLTPLVTAVGVMGLVMLGGDLGTVIILSMVVIGCLIFAGISWKNILIPIAGGAVAFLLLAIVSPNRVARITTFFGTSCTTDTNWCWQPLHGTWAMASGSIFGVGLGHSKAKWSWLPAADNDYIFAIIGEELGMIGCIVVLALLVILAVGFLRVIRSATDPMIRIATGGIMFWLVGQAFMNIAVVLGVIPVLGVPLPFISSGGTALFMALAAVGVVLSFARHNDRQNELR